MSHLFRAGAGAPLLLLLAAACRDDGPWTVDNALRPTLVRLDVDADGRVSQAEYERVAYNAPGFTQVDADQDGALDVEELADLLYGVDPAHFFVAPKPAASSRPEPAPMIRVRQTLAWRTLEALRQELAAVDPNAPLPSDAEVEEAAGLGLDSDAGIAVLVRLEAAYTRAGLAFPSGLLPDRATLPGG